MRAGQSAGQQCRERCRRHHPPLRLGGTELLEAATRDRRDHRREILAGLGGGFRIDAVARQLGDREQQAALAQIRLQRPQPIEDADHQSDLAPDLERRRIARAEDHERRLDDGGTAALELLLQRREIGGRRVFQLALARIERRIQAGAAAGSVTERGLQGFARPDGRAAADRP